MDSRKLVKWIFYAALAIVFSTLETRLLPHIRVFGVSPGFGAALTTAVAIYEGPAGGAFYGLACGALEYLAPGDSELVYMLVYMFGGYTIGALCDYALRRGLTSALLSALVLNTAATLVYFVFIIALPRRAGFHALVTAGTAEILMSTATVPLVYYPVRAVFRRWGVTEEQDL